MYLVISQTVEGLSVFKEKEVRERHEHCRLASLCFSWTAAERR